MQAHKTASGYAAITPTKRKEWAARYGVGRIHDIAVEMDSDNTYEFVILKPSRKVMEIVAQEGQQNVVAANNAFISNCILGGDMYALEYGDVYLAVLEHIGSLVKQKKVKVKKC